MAKFKIRCNILDKIRFEWRTANKIYVALSAAICLLCGIISSASTYMMGGRKFYYSVIHRPSYAPPSFVFPLVWTIIYLLIGVTLGLVGGAKHVCRREEKYKGILLFVLMMIFNFLWCPLFFAAQATFIALFDVGMMIALSLGTRKYFARISTSASIIMAGYIAWLIYCFIINFSIMLLN